MHVPGEYDYHFFSSERDLILEELSAQWKVVNEDFETAVSELPIVELNKGTYKNPAS